MSRCGTCDRPEATDDQFERHVREYDGRSCPTQAGTGECWCAGVCWGSTDCDVRRVDWRARAEAAEAAAAAMRGALVEARMAVSYGVGEGCPPEDACDFCERPAGSCRDGCEGRATLARIDTALASDAGADLLAEMGRLRADADSATARFKAAVVEQGRIASERDTARADCARLDARIRDMHAALLRAQHDLGCDRRNRAVRLSPCTGETFAGRWMLLFGGGAYSRPLPLDEALDVATAEGCDPDRVAALRRALTDEET